MESWEKGSNLPSAGLEIAAARNSAKADSCNSNECSKADSEMVAVGTVGDYWLTLPPAPHAVEREHKEMRASRKVETEMALETGKGLVIVVCEWGCD